MAQDQKISPGWVKLRCDCGAEQFSRLFFLRSKPGSGQVEEPAGWKCSGCGAQIDTAYLQRLVQISQRREELRAAQEELKSLEGAPQPTKK
ncbi:MAG: hypothetical protein HY323_09125 [Betaproteobacteria bacterium]|nr:hypothetical protein [Betaproteobacteria bacterium]